MQITIREPGSAITHFIAMMMAVFATVPLLVKAGIQSGWENFLAMAIFMGSHRQGRGVSGDYDHYRGFLHAGEKYLPVL